MALSPSLDSVRRMDVGFGGAPLDLVAGLESALDALADEAAATPFMVEAVDDRHGTLRFGIGQSDTFLSHEPADLEPPYRESRSPQGFHSPSTEPFIYSTDSLASVPEARVPWELGRAAFVEFCEMGRLSSAVTWVEV